MAISESTFYDQGGVRVTNSTITVAGAARPLAGVTKAWVIASRAKAQVALGAWTLVAIAGFVILFFAPALLPDERIVVEVVVIGWLVIMLGLLAWAWANTLYSVGIDGPHGGVLLSVGRDQAQARGIVFAIMRALAGTTSTTRRCPYCAEEVLTAAVICKHCGKDISVAGARAEKIQAAGVAGGAVIQIGCTMLALGLGLVALVLYFPTLLAFFGPR